MSIFIFLICTSALESSPFVLFRFSCPVSLLYHIGFLKIDLKTVNANDSKFTQMLLQTNKFKCVFMILSQIFCAWTFCKHLYDIVLFCIFGKCWYLFFSYVRFFIFPICTSALESSPFVLFRFFFPVSLLYHIEFLKIAFMKLIANYSKLSQMISNERKWSRNLRISDEYS